MRILAVADAEAKRFYDYYTPGCLDGFGLILACGDLDPAYLEFLVTMARCPVLYVHGNHDERFDGCPPEGCECIDDRLYVFKGLRIVGLGGSFRYRGGKYMYTEKQMRLRIWKLLPKIWRSKGFDILVTHAPALGLNDLENPAHRGFACFGRLLKKYRPRYFVHGHIHKEYGPNIPRRTELEHTTVINASGYCIFDFPEPAAGNGAKQR